jgi:hypothetical protein
MIAVSQTQRKKFPSYLNISSHVSDVKQVDTAGHDAMQTAWFRNKIPTVSSGAEMGI